MIGVREASGARVRSSRAALDDIHSSHCDPADMIHVMGSLDRRQVALRRSIAEADDGGYMPATEAERILEVWELTRDAWAFYGGADAEQRLQRNVAVLIRGKS